MNGFQNLEQVALLVLDMTRVVPNSEFVRRAQKILTREFNRDEQWYWRVYALLHEDIKRQMLAAKSPAVPQFELTAAAILREILLPNEQEVEEMWQWLVGRHLETFEVEERVRFARECALGDEQQGQQIAEAATRDVLRLSGALLLDFIADAGSQPTLRSVRRALRRCDKAIHRLSPWADEKEAAAAAA